MPGLRRAPRPALSTLGCVELSSLPTQCQHVLGSGGSKWASRASCVERCSFCQEATEAGGSNRDSWCPPTYATSSWAHSWPTRSLASRHGHRTQCRPAGFQAQPHDILSPAPPPLALPEDGEGSGREGGWGLRQFGAWVAECSCGTLRIQSAHSNKLEVICQRGGWTQQVCTEWRHDLLIVSHEI